MTWETFPRAPVVEAILDLRVSLPAEVDAAKLKDIWGPADGYPLREEVQEFTSEIRLSRNSVGSSHVNRPIGFMYLTDDRARIVQARLNGFTINHLKPYTNWASLFGEAQQRWPEFRSSARPFNVTRIALRYVNRIVVPRGCDVGDYFDVSIHVGKALPGAVRHRNMQVVVEHEERAATVVLKLGSQGVEGGDCPMILDIDVFREGAFAPESPEIWDTLSDLRELKNEVFFAATTERAKANFR